MTKDETKGVTMQDLEKIIAQVKRELLPLRDHFQLDIRIAARLETLFLRSLRENAVRMDKCLEAPVVETLPVSEELWQLLGKVMVGDNAHVEGLNHMATAIEFMQCGGNVLLVQNHTSGADTLVLHHVVNKNFNDAARQWLHMAGHVVNLFLLPLAITAGVRRIQIFSAKYCAQASDEVRARMQANNARALSSIGNQIVGGGQCIVLYPEGGRGN